jgi:hypothetical protein
MIGIGFGKRTKPKPFGFIPRYYDPAKEELQERLKKYDESTAEDSDFENMKLRIKSGLKMKFYGDINERNISNKRSNLRLFYIIIVLLIASYVLLSSNKVIALINAFSQD